MYTMDRNRIRELEREVTGTDFDLMVKQVGLLKDKYHGAMELVKNQKEYYESLIAHLATEEIL